MLQGLAGRLFWSNRSDVQSLYSVRLRVIVVSWGLMMGIMSRDMLTCTVFEEFMTQFTPLSAAKERPSGSFFQKQLGAGIYLPGEVASSTSGD